MCQYFILNISYFILRDAEWTIKSCPAKPPYTLEGKRKGILPDGEWRVFYPIDSIDKKGKLYMIANFHQGILDGKVAVFDRKGDTIGSAIYQRGIIAYNKYYDAYRRKFFPKEYSIDSIKAAQKEIDRRAISRHVIEHLAHLKDPKQIYQRDTIIWGVADSKYEHGNPIDFLKKRFVVKEQLTADENSPIRLRYATENGTVFFRYTKKTKEIDSTSYFIGNRYSQSFNPKTHTRITFNLDSTIREVESRLNDSVRITTEFYEKGNRYQETIDSFYLPPSYRNQPTINLYPIAEVKVWADSSRQNFNHIAPIDFIFTESSPNAIYTRTIKYYDPDNKLYAMTWREQDFRYLPDGSIDKQVGRDGTVKFDVYKGYYKDGTCIETTYQKEKSIKKVVKKDKNGKLITDAWYKQGVLQQEKEYAPGRGYLQRDTRLIDSIKLRYTRQYYTKQGLIYYTKSFERDIELGYEKNAEFEYYHIDSIGKQHLIAKLTQVDSATFLLKTWYLSGKPHILYAYYKGEGYPMQDQQEEEAYDWQDNEKEGARAYLKVWENGKLQGQGVRTTCLDYDCNHAFNCGYDSTGMITQEYLGDKQRLFDYPDANKKEACFLQDLPYQEGKIENNRRVGEWRGYYRTAEKQLQYRLSYNQEGVLDGLFTYYAKNGDIVEEILFKDGLITGEHRFYASDKSKTVKTYKMGDLLSKKSYDIKGFLLETNTYDGEELKESIVYAKNSNTVIQHQMAYNPMRVINNYTNYCDSTFDEKHRLLSANINDEELTIISKRDSTGKLVVTKSIGGTTFCATNIDYLQAINTALKEDKMLISSTELALDSIKAKTGVGRWSTLVGRMNALHLDTMAFQGVYLPLNTHVIRKGGAAAWTKADSLVLQDNYGHRFPFYSFAKKPLLLKVSADSFAKTENYALVQLNRSLNMDGRQTKIEIFNCKQSNNKVQVETMTKSFGKIDYPAKVLQVKENGKAASLFFQVNNMTVWQPYQHRFVESGLLRGWQSTLSKQAIAARVAALPIETTALVKTDAVLLGGTQTYKLAKGKLLFTPYSFDLVFGAPLAAQSDRKKVNRIRNVQDVFSPAYFPFHQTYSSDSTLQNDAFLNKPVLRTFIPRAYIRIPTIETEFHAIDILIDDKEINGSFSHATTEGKTLRKQILDYCKQKGIDVKVAESSSQTIYDFRIKVN